MVLTKEELIPVVTTALKDINQVTVNLCTAAHPDFPDKQRIALLERLSAMISPVQVDWLSQDIQGVFFLSGGSEKEAIQKIGNDRHVMLLSFAENNAFASAVEVKSYLDGRGIESDLFNLSDSLSAPLLTSYLSLVSKVRASSHKRFGLVGKVSDWLVHSNPDPNHLRNKFGHRLVIIPWSETAPLENYSISPQFLEVFKGYGAKKLEDHSRVFTLLTTLMEESQLDGITVECFPMVQEKAVSACLSLALLNHLGIPAACEGDLVSLTGMFLVRDLVGGIPWMANLSGIFHQYIELSHCTVPLGLVNDARLETHFETGKGMAIRGLLNFEDCTLFRMDQSFLTAFIAHGQIERSEYSPFSCRTQVRVILEDTDIQTLISHPLGNHHLVIPGNHTEILRKAMRIFNILVIN